MNYQHLLVQHAHDIFWVTLHRPETRNALSPEMVAELAHVFIQAAQNDAVRALVLRGSAGFFCAGGNVGNFQSRLQADAHGGEDPVVNSNRAFGHVLQALTALPMPVMAVVEGAAMGGGMGLACCADIVLATEDARFALSETGLGLIPAQIAPFVQARVGRRVALRLGLSGERVSGALAEQLGLVDALAKGSAELNTLQAQWLSRILACGPQANRSLKALLSRHAGPEATPADALGAWLDDAAQRFAQCMRSEGGEGIAAFRERRAPAWGVTLEAADVARLHGLTPLLRSTELPMRVTKNIRPFHTVLVANRGEIALRVLRTVRRMGYGAVAVYSEADRDSPHVQAADRAVCIGPAAPAQSYLNIEAILEAARLAGADAVHPGYGFLSENDAFADAVDAAGLVFIGPSGDNIRAMGNKAGAKRLMQAAGMPCIPGYEDEDQSDETFVRAAERIGFPIMCKAAAGGGGRGMRLVQQASDLPAALDSARSEARTAFGSAELILERAVTTPRHVEIQLLADSHGHVVHLGERDCSVQRRHQKVIEEAPSPAVDAALRQRMGEAAVHSARTLGYIGAGTMEFLLDAEGHFYFMEMNTRLQVEHAVTEAITGLDLVEWQLRVAAGEALPFAQQDIQLQGHAIEVRLTAEDVPAGFLPQTGPVLRWRPPSDHDVRIDSALVEGGEVSPHYDSMVAKLVAHGRDREEARRKLLAAVRHCVLLGLPSNQGFLADGLSDAVFVQGTGVHTGFVAERMGLPPAAPMPSTRTVALAALAAQAATLPCDTQGHLQAPTLAQGQAMGLLQWGEQRWQYRIRSTRLPHRPDQGADHSTAWEVQCTALGSVVPASTSAASSATSQTPNTHTTTLTHVQWQDNAHTELALECQGLREQICTARTDSGVHLFHAGRAWAFECPPTHRAAGPEAGSGAVLAPLTARVLQVMVTPGQTVQAGERLLVLEAMKMEHTLTAPFTGVVRELLAQTGGQALKGALLMQVEAEAA